MREHHRSDERRSGGRGQGRGQGRQRGPQDWRERPQGQRFARRPEGEGAWGGLADTGDDGHGRWRDDEGYGRQGGGERVRGFGRPEPGDERWDPRRRGSGRDRTSPEEWRQIRRDDVGVAQQAYGFGGGYGRDEQWGADPPGDPDWTQPLYAGPNRDDEPNYGPSLGPPRRGDYGALEQEQAWVAGGGPERWHHDDGFERGFASHDRRPPYARGPHAGKGPRGWTRSDDRILEDVCEALTRDPEIDASDIEVSCSGGEITLRGTVDSRRTRRRAEECIEDLPGVRDVHNELRTQDRREAREPASGGGEPRDAGAPVRRGELSQGGVVSGEKIG